MPNCLSTFIYDRNTIIHRIQLDTHEVQSPEGSHQNRCPSEDSQTPTRCKVQKGVIKTDAPRRTVRHPRGAKSRRESSKQMPPGGQSDTHEVQSPEGSHRNRCPSEDSQTPTRCKVQKGVIETDAPRRTVRHPRGAKSRRESSKQMPLGGQSDTHEVQSPEGSHRNRCPSEDS
jgi:hypothetical protein